jgi:uncharacterized repeat protein (TIGR01451 family)/CSLREA domain-containing protein
MYLLIALVLAVLTGCQDATAPLDRARPQFAQGDGGIWTVNSVEDPGDGTCDDAQCTLREAIAAAASGDSIVFAAGLQDTIRLEVGVLDIDGKSLTIDGDDRIVIDAQKKGRAFFISGLDKSVELRRLVVTNGNGGFSGDGGGIAAVSVALTLDRVSLAFNEAASDGHGGGMTASNATVTIRNSVIHHNSAGEDGGGIYVTLDASLTLINSTVDGNGADANGGGIYNAGSLNVIASTFSGNGATVTGGALYNAADGDATLVLSTISGNTSNNTAGILNTGNLELRSVTVTRNSGTTGGINNFETATVANSIIAGNSGTTAVDCSPPITSLGHNVVGPTCGFSAPGDLVVAAAQVFTQVLEQELKDNGGPTKTHALIARGLAVDAGYCPGETEDQRGFSRPVDDPVMPNALDACDIGAYEIQGPVAVVADLMISQAVDRTSVKQGDLLTYFVRVQNLGPQDAANVVVNDVLSSGVTFVSARSNKGTLTAPPKGENGTVTWYVGTLDDQANEVAEIAVTVLVKGKTTITNTAAVTGDVVDPNEANNSASITVSVAAGSGGGGSGGGGNGNGGGPKK